nr:hypothetical protein [Fimbriiglobus sp.]
VVAYSGEKDKQKLAADLIEAKLKNFKEPHRFTHLVAPGLEHQQPPEWQAKLETEYQKHLAAPEARERFRFVTYTPNQQGPETTRTGPRVLAKALEKQYEKAVVDWTYKDGHLTVSTSNVRELYFVHAEQPRKSVTVDGFAVPFDDVDYQLRLERADGKWKKVSIRDPLGRLVKDWHQCGPIDDGFTQRFWVNRPTGKPWHEEVGTFAKARQEEFAKNWDKHFRGELPIDNEVDLSMATIALFGDPQSNPAIAKLLPNLPITWTKEKLVVNGKTYDPKTHLPVLIYPNPRTTFSYIVINSGHTFREADFKGTNALLYPRLGDWAVLKPKPTKDDPAGFEVVDAGLFDENWQFKK